MEEKVFYMVPGSQTQSLWFWGIVAFMAALTLYFAYQACSMNNIKFEITPQGLRIRAAMYGRFIPSSALRRDEAKVLDLTTEVDHRPKMRTNGVCLPGYCTGWYRLRNSEKALMFVTDRTNVVYVPTSEGFSILMSVRDADEFVKELRK